MLTYERLKTRATEFLALTGLTVKEFDAYINLTEMGARWYDADLGRWISPDPIVPQPGNRQAFNRYSALVQLNRNVSCAIIAPTLVCEGGRCD